MSTGTILGLSKEEESRINLLYKYIEKSIEQSLNQNEYWNYKVIQNDVRKHNYNDAIFKLLFIWCYDLCLSYQYQQTKEVKRKISIKHKQIHEGHTMSLERTLNWIVDYDQKIRYIYRIK